MSDEDLVRRAVEKRLRLSADCGCGGKMIPHPWRRLTWICDRSHWWNRKKQHAYLTAQVGEARRLADE